MDENTNTAEFKIEFSVLAKDHKIFRIDSDPPPEDKSVACDAKVIPEKKSSGCVIIWGPDSNPWPSAIAINQWPKNQANLLINLCGVWPDILIFSIRIFACFVQELPQKL